MAVKQIDVERIAFSVRECARRIGCGHDKLYQEIRAGRLRAKKMGKLTRVTAEEERRYLDSLPRLELGEGRDD